MTVEKEPHQQGGNNETFLMTINENGRDIIMARSFGVHIKKAHI